MPERIPEGCYAPLFKPHSMIEAVIGSVLGYLLIAVLFPFSRSPRVSCLIKQCQFYIRYALRGNDNPNIPL
jgi:hypothetical protein